MKTQIFKSHLDFEKRTDKKMNGVSRDFAKMHPDFEKQNESNEGCWDCSFCQNCSNCYECHNCNNCSNSFGLFRKKDLN